MDLLVTSQHLQILSTVLGNGFVEDGNREVLLGYDWALAGPLCLWQTVTKAFLLFNPNNGVSTQAWSAVYCGRLVPQGDESLNYKALLLILLVLVYSSKLSARFLLSKQGQEEVNLDEITSEGTEDSELMNLTGSELCDGGDEECLTRRIIAEAHLDYIYTQHHKP
ncbi:hypothetical protein D5086_018768 [Populus alba]|uniref:Uncharacterized protein n=1 Tax=Populus alba TaxID=43335 RepID=A0ACC4BQM0_POPAL